jgi:hypothetical protein
MSMVMLRDNFGKERMQLTIEAQVMMWHMMESKERCWRIK